LHENWWPQLVLVFLCDLCFFATLRANKWYVSIADAIG
jgi:hypothetical protein